MEGLLANDLLQRTCPLIGSWTFCVRDPAFARKKRLLFDKKKSIQSSLESNWSRFNIARVSPFFSQNVASLSSAFNSFLLENDVFQSSICFYFEGSLSLFSHNCLRIVYARSFWIDENISKILSEREYRKSSILVHTTTSLIMKQIILLQSWNHWHILNVTYTHV